ncbi:WD domain, G-beta repeat [Plasmodiophora brassicae]
MADDGSMTAPLEITFGDDCHVHDIALHPGRNIGAAALIDGAVHVFGYEPGRSAATLHTARHHKDACRSVAFTACGSGLVTGSKDRSLGFVDMESGVVVHHEANAHNAAVNVVAAYGTNLFAAGDDEGDLSLWDVRTSWRSPALSWKQDENADYISDMCPVVDRHHMLVTCADGTLGVWDVRGKGSLFAMSDDVEDELLSVQVIKSGNKVVCGTQDGMVLIWSYGDFGDYDERFPGHPESIESMVVVDADTICTASSDGLIRVVQIHPNKLLGVVGRYEFPVECIRLSHDRQWIASSSHDGAVKFWEAGFLFEADDDDDVDMDVDADTPRPGNGFFAGLD